MIRTSPSHDVGVTTLEELADISDAVCDQYFDVERLEHDVDKGELRIAIYPGRRKTRWMIEVTRPPQAPLPAPIGTLIVREVEEVSVQDEPKIGWYPVSGLEFDPDASRLAVVSNVPCEIVIRCRELDIEFIRE